MLPQFQYIVDKSGEKGNVGGWLSVRIKLVERPVVCLGKYGEIFKQYIFIKKMWTHKGKCWIVPKDKWYGIMKSRFVFVYPLTVPYLQTIIGYRALHPKYVATYTHVFLLI